MDVLLIAKEVIVKIFLLGMVGFAGVCLAAIFWAVYIYTKED